MEHMVCKISLRITLFLLMAAIQMRVGIGDGGAPVENQSYQLDVCIHFAQNPLFTKQFRNSIERQVTDQLESVFGPLVDLQVINIDAGKHFWLLEKRGGRWWHELDKEKQSQWLAKHPGDKKICYVYIDFKEGRYRTHIIFLDERYQWIGPLQVNQSADRQWIARDLIQNIYMGLPVNLRVTKTEDSNDLLIQYQAGKWIDRLNDKMKKKPVYILYRVLEQSDGSEKRQRVADTYLIIDSENNEGKPRLVSRYIDPMKLQDSGRLRVIGFEALNLPTQNGRISITVLDRESKVPAVGCQVTIMDLNKLTPDAEDVYGEPDAKGKVRASNEMSHLALIKVRQGEVTVERPVAITEPHIQYEMYVDADPQVANRNRMRRAMIQMKSDLNSLTAFVRHEDRRLAALAREKKYEEACEVDTKSKDLMFAIFMPIRQGFKDLDTTGLNSDEMRTYENLRKRIRDTGRTVQKRRAKDEYCKMRNKANNSNKADLEVREGNAALERLDVEAALQHYLNALVVMEEHAYFDKNTTSALRDKYERIREQWNIKENDNLHRTIRKQVYEQLGNLELREFMHLKAKIKKNLKHLVKQDDEWTLKYLHRQIEERIDELNKAIIISKETNNVEEAKECKMWMEQLSNCHKEFGQEINKMRGGESADEIELEEEPDEEDV